MNRSLAIAGIFLPLITWGQDPVSRLSAINPPPDSPSANPAAPAAPKENSFQPTWETQKNSRTYLLSIPPPRGQIADRNGLPLAQTRVSYNLGIQFPTPLAFSDRDVLRFAQTQAVEAGGLIGRPINVNAEAVLKHYKNRGVVPYILIQDLKPQEYESIKKAASKNLVLQPTYQRFYPNAGLAGHVIGYAGRTGRMPDGVLQNNDPLWPGAEGRDGLEQAFNEQLNGKPGQLNISFDPSGKKVSEQVVVPPQPGYNIITTIDENIQRLCEDSLAKGCKRGAIVVMDPNNGDILAMASWPTLNPNAFIPVISAEDYKALQDDKNIPLLPRAFRSAYPPGSTFKVFVGLAALNSGEMEPGDEFNCPPSMEIGNLTFRNWKKEHTGSLDFADALTQSCNTWFYQCGIKIGGSLITDYSARLGLGMKTGIPLSAEVEGRVMNDDYMQKVYKRKMLNGDLANLSIGQGDTLISPLQMAQAMATVGNGGILYQARLVSQVQSIDGQIVHAYDVRARSQIDINDTTLKELRRGLVQVVESRSGTAGRAQVDGIHVGGKTGTAQWGPKNNERTAAWFAGFAPAKQPKYAFAAVYEGEPNDNDVHGGTHAAPLIGRVLKELYKDEGKKKKQKGDDDFMTPVKKKEEQAPDEESASPPKPAEQPKPAPTPKRSFWNFFRPGGR